MSGRIEGVQKEEGVKKKKSLPKLKNATKWNKDECSSEPQTEYKRQSCEIYMAAGRVGLNAKLQTVPVAHNTGPWSRARWSATNI